MCRPAGQKHKSAEDDKNIKKLPKEAAVLQIAAAVSFLHCKEEKRWA